MADTNLYSLDSQLDFLGVKSADGIQAVYNSALVGRETTIADMEGFVYDEAQYGYEYEQLELDGVINAMASIVGYDSEPDAIGKSVNARKLTGSIPRQRLKIVRGENDYRDMLKASADVRTKAILRGDNPYNTLYDYYANNLFDTLAQFTDGHVSLVNNMIGKMLSKGGYEVNVNNNPQGAYGTVTFSANVPEANVVNTEWWTKDAEGNITYIETVDPIKELWKSCRIIRDDVTGNGYEDIKIRVDRKTFYEFLDHPSVKVAVGYALNGNLRMTKDNDKNALSTAEYAYYHDDEAALVTVVRRLIGVDVLELKNTVCGVAKFDKTEKVFKTTKIKAFEEGVFVLSPTGVIGTIKNVIPVRPDKSAVYANIFGGRGIIEYRYNPEQKIQTWVSELTVLPILNNPSKVFYFNVVGETTAE